MPPCSRSIGPSTIARLKRSVVRRDSRPLTVWTVGHSTHSLDELLALLATAGVTQLADIRTVPRSRRHPHFRSDALAESLPANGLAYRLFPGLGGFRRPRPDSPNGAWRNESFRGYADYAMTDEFARALDELREWARNGPTAIMCSESLWWRCHRRLVADQLVERGDQVVHIGPDGRATEHEQTPFAVVDGERVTYPP
jgi:uncharacterized protein (DUF488 family)